MPILDDPVQAPWGDDAEAYVRSSFAAADANPLRYGPPPHEAQLRILRSSSKRKIVVAANRVGKALRHGTPVLTPQGWRAIESLDRGDLVMAGDGSVTSVRATYRQGEVPLFRVTFDDNVTVDCCADHLWVAKDPEARFRKPTARASKRQGYGKRYGQWRVVSTREILGHVGGRPKAPARYSIPVTGPVAFPDWGDLPLDPYLLGVLIGDGGFSHGTVRLSSVDQEVVDRVRVVLPAGCVIKKCVGDNCDWSIVGPVGRDRSGHRTNPVTEALRQLGLMGKKSPEKWIPDSYKFSASAARLALLNGLMDTDGTVGRKGHCSFASSSRRLAEDVLFLVQSFGGKGTIRAQRTARLDSHVVMVSQGAEHLFSLSRKRARIPPTRPRCRERVIVSVEPVDPGLATCIEVAHPDGTYLTTGCVVTHNTAAAVMWDALWCARGEHPYRSVPLIKDVWIGAPDFPSYERFHRPAFEEWCPRSWQAGPFHETDRRVDIRRVDGRICRLSFLSYDMPRSKWQGAGVGKIVLDEEMPEEIVNECIARLVTTDGELTLAFTPVEGPGWWYDRIWVPALKGANEWEAFRAPLALRDPSKPFEVGESLVPHITTEQVQRFAREIPDESERSARIFGEPVSKTGLVYKGFATDLHVVEPFEIPEYFDFVGAVDPGYHGFAATMMVVSPQGALFVTDEYFSQERPTKERFKDLLAILEERIPIKVQKTRPTVTFFVDTEDPQVVLELNLLAADIGEKRKEGPMLAFASLDQGLKARKAGHTRIQQLLAQDPERRTPSELKRKRPLGGEPGLYFFKTLYSEWRAKDATHEESRLLWEIAHFAWKKATPKDPHPDEADEASAHGAHGMASLRYAVMARTGAPDKPPEDELEHLPPIDRWVQKQLRDALRDVEGDEGGLEAGDDSYFHR